MINRLELFHEEAGKTCRARGARTGCYAPVPATYSLKVFCVHCGSRIFDKKNVLTPAKARVFEAYVAWDKAKQAEMYPDSAEAFQAARVRTLAAQAAWNIAEDAVLHRGAMRPAGPAKLKDTA